jgi:CheY-like chemotaxis protein
MYEPTELGDFTAELADGFRSAIENTGLRFTVNCPVLDEQVYVDREMWEKLVLNLLSNALKCTVQGVIGISIRQTDHKVELSVWDTGNGIGMTDSGKRTAEGTGIGVALVKEVAKSHGGTVRLESTAGEGSRFTVSIPLGAAHLPAERIGAPRRSCSKAHPVEVLANEPQCISSGYTHEPPPLKSRGCILVVEDNADMRNYVQGLLSKHYEVYAVSDGDQALTLLRRVRPDLVLSDVIMPHVSGISLVRAIRLNPATRTLPVILLSGEVTEASRAKGLETGANDYVVKPFSSKELLARVAAQVKLGRATAFKAS